MFYLSLDTSLSCKQPKKKQEYVNEKFMNNKKLEKGGETSMDINSCDSQEGKV